MPQLESLIADWKSYLLEKGHFTPDQEAELEAHLRDAVAGLQAKGLDEEEAFFIAIKRMGNLPSLASEYARVHTDQLWKQLLVDPTETSAGRMLPPKILTVVALALLAGLPGKVPTLFGVSLYNDAGILVHFVNAGFFVSIPLALLFGSWHRAQSRRPRVVVGAVIAVPLLLINLYPSLGPEHTRILTGLHLPIFLWIVVGFLYMGDAWREVGGRMNFIRFTGETFVYTVLILCGMGVLMIMVGGLFSVIGLRPGDFIRDYLMVFAGCSAPVLGAFFAQEKRAIVENMAPVLARIFAPLFLVMLVAFLAFFAFKGQIPHQNREFLILFDLMLALVLGIVLYMISARRASAPVGAFDWIAAALIACALLANAIALSAMLVRLSQFGPSANKVAALGENLLLCVHLAGLGYTVLRFNMGKAPFAAIERWLTRYLWVYFAWAGIVALLFPPLFGFK